jgi:methyl-accepting chemotaxis protein
MTSKDDTPPSHRIASLYKQLSDSASQLNAASDELGKSLSALDAALKRLNLGISAWVKVTGYEHDTGEYWNRCLGYTKVGGKWGIAISESSGDHNTEHETSEEWLFNDAPRAFRIEAVEKLPELIERLIKEADETTKSIQHKAVQAQELAAAVTETAQTAQRRKSGASS